jgi:dienelactone hydrolase
MKGYLATDPERQGKRPGILVVHEWWGHNEYARTRARMLAELGYTALALDMYGNGKQAHSPDEAAAFAAAVMEDVETMKARFDAALAYLRSHESVDRTRTGAIGYCFGGGVVLNVVRLGADLDAAVSFHGILTTGHPAQFGTVATKVLVCNGAEDPLTPGEHVEAFRKEFDDAHVDYRFIDYEGATHSWTNPASDSLARKFGLPFRYSATADSLSWADMKKFFEGVFEQ